MSYEALACTTVPNLLFNALAAHPIRLGRAACTCCLLGALELHPTVAVGADVQTRNSWQELGLLNIGRIGCKAQSIDGHRAIVVSGWGDPDQPADNTAEILDTNTGQWAFAAPIPAGFEPGANPWTANLGNGYVLVAGGFNAVDTGNLQSYIYSVSRNAWTRTGDLPPGSTVGSNFNQIDAVVLDDGRVLAAGGLAPGVAATNASVVFTPNYTNLNNGLSGNAVGTWDFTRDAGGRVTRLSGPTEHHKLVKLMDGRVLIVVGYDKVFRSGKWGSIFRDTPGVQAEVFDPATGTWTPLPNMPAIPGEDDRHGGVKGVRQQAAAALLGDGRVLITGGSSEPTTNDGKPLLKELYYVRSSAILFDPAKFDAGAYPWSVTAPMHVAREVHVMGNLPGSGGTLAVWGATQDAATGTAEIYDPEQRSWRFASSLPEVPGTGLPVSFPYGCSTMMPGGNMLLIGGGVDIETDGTSRRTYLYRP